jgi:ACR3 family arsenite efflux pump ArsB
VSRANPAELLVAIPVVGFGLFFLAQAIWPDRLAANSYSPQRAFWMSTPGRIVSLCVGTAVTIAGLAILITNVRV